LHGWLTTTTDDIKQERRTTMIFMVGWFEKDAVIGRTELTSVKAKVNEQLADVQTVRS
jgi:hypothetical protein